MGFCEVRSCVPDFFFGFWCGSASHSLILGCETLSTLSPAELADSLGKPTEILLHSDSVPSSPLLSLSPPLPSSFGTLPNISIIASLPIDHLHFKRPSLARVSSAQLTTATHRSLGSNNQIDHTQSLRSNPSFSSAQHIDRNHTKAHRLPSSLTFVTFCPDDPAYIDLLVQHRTKPYQHVEQSIQQSLR